MSSVPIENVSSKHLRYKISSQNCNYVDSKMGMVKGQSNFFQRFPKEYAYEPGDSDQEMFKKINGMIQSHSDSSGLTMEAFEKLTDDVLKKSKFTPSIDRSGRLVARCYENNSDQTLNCASVVEKFHQTVAEVSMDVLKTYQV